MILPATYNPNPDVLRRAYARLPGAPLPVLGSRTMPPALADAFHRLCQRLDDKHSLTEHAIVRSERHKATRHA